MQPLTPSAVPVDVLVVADNSGSMTPPLLAFEQQVNTFAATLGTRGLDYRLILVSRHGSATTTQSVCVPPPLSGNATCAPPPTSPTNGPRFFHYSTEIGSTNALRELLATVNAPGAEGTGPSGWSPWLRTAAFKHLVVITDDNEMIVPAQFDQQLTSMLPAQFGTSSARNYVLHGLLGVVAKPTPTEPYLPSEATVTSKCTSAANTGSVYQDLARLTGGLRLPLCDPTSYDQLLGHLASGIAHATPVSCSLTLPAAPAWFGPSNRLALELSTGASTLVLSQVVDAATCQGGGFFVQGGNATLCPLSCTAFRANAQPNVGVRFACH